MADSDAADDIDATDVVRARAIELLAIAQSGLHYGRDAFDRHRYDQVRTAALALLELVSTGSLHELRRMVAVDTGYATPKVDVRAPVFDDERVLLVRERSDGLWSLPGGWCDVLESPSEAVAREVREESGVIVDVVELAAVLDRERQENRPPLPFHVYKLFFVCNVARIGVPEELETIEVGWFSMDALPPLSVARVTEAQISLMHEHHQNPGRPATFD
jgi:ADP-ribose pyrophosphatase YjhB (NUDIX family)